MTRDYEIVLTDHSGQHFTGKVACELQWVSTADTQRRLCAARLSFNLQEFVGTGGDYFSAFQEVRRQLEPLNIRALCLTKRFARRFEAREAVDSAVEAMIAALERDCNHLLCFGCG